MKKITESLVLFIAVIECAIGLGTGLGLFLCPLFQSTGKAPGVFAFVLTASMVSFFIGLGLLLKKEWARGYLVYFSGYILLEKLLIFLGVLTLNGKMVSHVLGVSTDIYSLVYHGAILALLSLPKFRSLFR